MKVNYSVSTILKISSSSSALTVFVLNLFLNDLTMLSGVESLKIKKTFNPFLSDLANIVQSKLTKDKKNIFCQLDMSRYFHFLKVFKIVL